MKETKLFICVSIGYYIRRLYARVPVEDYEDNLTENQTEGKELHKIAAGALDLYPSMTSFMLETRDPDINVLIENLAKVNNIDHDSWDPVFECSTMLEALTTVPKICRNINWSLNPTKDQKVDGFRTFPLKDGIGTVVFLTLEAERD